MAKSQDVVFGEDGAKVVSEPPAPAGPPTKGATASAWDVTIRGHYLAHEMRYYCTAARLPIPEVTRLAAAALQTWATRYGAELEALARKG